MPFCPKCRYEYNWGIGTCPDCDERLVEKLPEEPEAVADAVSHENWTPLVRVISQMKAALVLQGLRAKDIPAVINSGTGHFGHAGAMGESSFAPVGGGFTIVVPEEFLVDAIQEAQVLLGEEWEKVKLVNTDT